MILGRRHVRIEAVPVEGVSNVNKVEAGRPIGLVQIADDAGLQVGVASLEGAQRGAGIEPTCRTFGKRVGRRAQQIRVGQQIDVSVAGGTLVNISQKGGEARAEGVDGDGSLVHALLAGRGITPDEAGHDDAEEVGIVAANCQEHGVIVGGDGVELRERVQVAFGGGRVERTGRCGSDLANIPREVPLGKYAADLGSAGWSG